MKISKLIYAIAVIIVLVWVLGWVFKFAAWLINGLLYVAAIIVIIGLIVNFMERRKNK